MNRITCVLVIFVAGIFLLAGALVPADFAVVFFAGAAVCFSAVFLVANGLSQSWGYASSETFARGRPRFFAGVCLLAAFLADRLRRGLAAGSDPSRAASLWMVDSTWSRSC